MRNGNKLSVSAMTFAEMIKLLHEGEYTKKLIQEKLGIANNTVQRWLEVLYRRKLVYIAAWERGPRGNPAAMWAFGYEMEDAPKPKPLTTTEYAQRYRAKKRGVLGLVAV
jgi:transcription initiation factor IIE alpha subunit